MVLLKDLLLQLKILSESCLEVERKLDMISSTWIQYFHVCDAFDELAQIIVSIQAVPEGIERLESKFHQTFKLNAITSEEESVEAQLFREGILIPIASKTCVCNQRFELNDSLNVESSEDISAQESSEIIANTSIKLKLPDGTSKKSKIPSSANYLHNDSSQIPVESFSKMVAEKVHRKRASNNLLLNCLKTKLQPRTSAHRTRTKLATQVKAQAKLKDILSAANNPNVLNVKVHCPVCKNHLNAKYLEGHVRLHGYQNISAIKSDFPEFVVPVECKVCRKWCKNARFLAWHKRRKCETLKTYKQILKEVCVKRKSGYYLDHEDEPIECNVCYEMILPITVKEHYKSHGKKVKNTVQCAKCQKVFQSSKKLAWHLRCKCGTIKPFRKN